MRWSWKLGKYGGIDVFLHTTFLILLGWIALSYWAESRSLAAAVAGVGFFLLLFLCVLLHEFGHALTARRYGIKTRNIVLLPIGGVARLERMPEEPGQELRVALAGPAVNVVIVAVLYALLKTTGGLDSWARISLISGPILQRLMLVNVFLAGFNLIPAFPMDGGRVLRALLAMRMEYTKATQIAASIGQGLAMVLGFVGLFVNPFLLFIALFVWIGAAQEASMVQMKGALGGIPVERAMMTDFRTVEAGAPLRRAVELTLGGSQKDFPVMEHGRLAGILTHRGLLKVLAERGQDVPISEVMERDVRVAHPSEMMEVVFVRLQECDCHTLPVLVDGKLIGLVTMENVGEFLRIQSALSR